MLPKYTFPALDIAGEEAHLPSDADTYLESYIYAMRTFDGKIAVKPSSLIPASVFEKNTYEENKELLKEKNLYPTPMAFR